MDKRKVIATIMIAATSAAVLSVGCGPVAAPSATNESTSSRLETTAGSAAGSVNAADTARIFCGISGRTRVLTPRVEAQPDGVHFVIDNGLGKATRYTFVDSGAGRSGAAPMGESAHVEESPPGEVLIGCYEPAEGDEQYPGGNLDYSEPDYGSFEVVDPHGVYKSAGLECVSKEAVTGFSYGVAGDDRDVEVGDPVELTRRTLAARLAKGDVVEPAGYPEGRNPDTPRLVRVVRDSRVVATVEYFGEPERGWSESSMSNCSDF